MLPPSMISTEWRAFALLAASLAVVAGAAAQPPSIEPATMARIGTVDERFQSYNIEMIEVTGGRFWKPYSSMTQSASAPGPPGADLYEYRPPIDLSNRRLRALASALGPAYVRVSGTWANTVYFHDSDEPAPQTPPAGFGGVLTRAQWKGVVEFARATNARIITSFALGAGTRDAAGVWTPDQARRFVTSTTASGGQIAAAEFMNEPNFAGIGGMPNGYDAAAFARDVDVFRKFFREALPGSLFLGPGSVGEGGVIGTATTPGRLSTEDLMKATGPVFDVFSYHIYSAVSQRCARGAPALGTTPDAARSNEWLSRTDPIHAFYAGLRDRFAPGKPMWVTEEGDAACGGNPWASTFLDTFRFLDQRGRLAQQGVQVIAHNTLAASDYGLIDEKTLAPRPNYWAALIWHRLMGPIVLRPTVSPASDVYAYAHCMRERRGGVTVLAINAGAAAVDIGTPSGGERYTLTAPQPDSATVQLNGVELRTGSDGAPPRLTGAAIRGGRVTLPAASITFIAFPRAGNSACQ
jgi:hypothetical protein